MNTSLALQTGHGSAIVPIFSRVDQLDLGCIKVKLVDKDEGEGWNHVAVTTAEIWYKRFLFLNLKYPDLSIVPNKIIDTFWHYHILDTWKYPEDCDMVFGYFLHHFPYFGMRGPEDALALEDAFSVTQDLFQKEFGESLDSLVDVFAKEGLLSSICSGSCSSCKSPPTPPPKQFAVCQRNCAAPPEPRPKQCRSCGGRVVSIHSAQRPVYIPA